MITLYGFPNSRSLRAAWALEEAGADYAYVKVDLRKGEGRRPPFLALNAGGKVPALVADDLVLTESGAIVTWIGERHPRSGLVPPPEAAAARAAYFQWAFFVLSELEQPLWTIAKARFALPEKHRVPAIEPTATWEFGVAAKLLEKRLADAPYLAGDGFTGADVLATHALAWARSARLEIASARLRDYLERNWARPARVRAEAREAANPVVA